MNPPHAIVIGASAAGVAALLELAAALPRELDAVIGMVLHVGSRHSILPQLLTARGRMTAIHPEDGQPLRTGVIHVAPPDFHMTFTAGRVRLSRLAREEPRPSGDRSAVPFRRACVRRWDNARPTVSVRRLSCSAVWCEGT